MKSNGNRSGHLDEALETYVEVPSDNVPFDQAPAMKAAEINITAAKAYNRGLRAVYFGIASADTLVTRLR